MADVNNIDDLIKLGKLNKETLVLEGGGKIFIREDLVIPFSLKLTGNTSIVGTGSALRRPNMTFIGPNKPAICASAQASTTTLDGLSLVSLHSPLFSVKRNKMDNVTLIGCIVDAPLLGEISTNSLRLIRTSFINPKAIPLDLDSINSINIVDVANLSKYPLIDFSGGKVLRNTITIWGKQSTDTSLICIGRRDDTGCTAFTHIPDHSILVENAGVPRHQLLSVIDGYRYITLPEASTRGLFV